MVATPKVTSAVKLPIHCQFSFRSQTPKYAAKLRAKRGRKTRKPTDAANPIPRNKLIMVPGSIFMLMSKIGYS